MTGLWIAALASLAFGCGASTPPQQYDTVSDAGQGFDVDTGYVSSETQTLSSLDDVCDGNPQLTGRAIVNALLPRYEATFSYIGQGTPTPLTIDVSYTNGTITCHTHWTCKCGAPDIPAWIEVTAKAKLATKDGTFNESFDAQIALRFYANGLELSGSVPIASLGGTYKPLIGGTWSTHAVAFGGQLRSAADAGGPGTTTGSATEQASNSGMGQAIGIGDWK